MDDAVYLDVPTLVAATRAEAGLSEHGATLVGVDGAYSLELDASAELNEVLADAIALAFDLIAEGEIAGATIRVGSRSYPIGAGAIPAA